MLYNHYNILLSSYFFEIQVLYACVDQVRHFLTVLINCTALLHSEEEVGDLCTFTFDDGREDAVKVL